MYFKARINNKEVKVKTDFKEINGTFIIEDLIKDELLKNWVELKDVYFYSDKITGTFVNCLPNFSGNFIEYDCLELN